MLKTEYDSTKPSETIETSSSKYSKEVCQNICEEFNLYLILLNFSCSKQQIKQVNKLDLFLLYYLNINKREISR